LSGIRFLDIEYIYSITSVDDLFNFLLAFLFR